MGWASPKSPGFSALDWDRAPADFGALFGAPEPRAPGLPLPVPVRRLVLNDVGPAVRWEALQRIGTYLGQDPVFDSADAAIDYLAGWRLSLAQRLLAQGRQVKSIADEVGYGSPNALTRAFAQRLGQTPGEWLAGRAGSGA
mgnify:CR=1 FL=1